MNKIKILLVCIKICKQIYTYTNYVIYIYIHYKLIQLSEVCHNKVLVVWVIFRYVLDVFTLYAYEGTIFKEKKLKN